MATNPENFNYLSPLGFNFVLKRAPTLMFFSHSLNLPGLNLTVKEQATPFVNIPRPGEKLTFEPVSLRFGIDEDMENYLEIFNWMISLGYPDNFDQIGIPMNAGSFPMENLLSDGTLIINTNKQNANKRINFYNMFPISLNGNQFDATMSDVQHMEATVTFQYRNYTLDTV